MATIVQLSRPRKRKDEDDDDDDDEEEDKPIIAKTATDLQRLRLEKLMKNPEKPVPIPERPKDKSMPHVPDFVRNVMGSSAGAGSGEFHVYRHLRRKEYARQKFIQEKADKETKNDDYHRKLEENKRLADERTAKKRAKRLKKKQRQKLNKKLKTSLKESKGSESETDGSESDSEEDGSSKAKQEKVSGQEGKSNSSNKKELGEPLSKSEKESCDKKHSKEKKDPSSNQNRVKLSFADYDEDDE